MLKLRQIAFSAVALIGAVALTSCSPDAADPTAPTISGVTAHAKGGKRGGGGDATSQDPSVNAADPASVPKGSANVDLQIFGSGFTTESDVAFQLNGKRTNAIRTNSLTFVDESTLVANVDVDEDALEDFYDIEVRNGPKKRGVGIDLLEILPFIQGTLLPGDFVGDDPFVYQAAGGLLTGKDDECGFVYEIATAERHCLDLSAHGIAADQISPVGLNPSGRIVAVSDATETRHRYIFVLDWTASATTATRLSSPGDGWEPDFAWRWSVNEAGEVLVELRRPHPAPPRNDPSAIQETVGIWSPDLSSVAVGPPFDGFVHTRGLTDNGTALFKFGADGYVWNGQPGSTPSQVNQGKDRPTIEWITPGGLIYGTDAVHHTTYMWTDPNELPTVVSDLAIDGPHHHDREEHLLGTANSTGYCVSPWGSHRILVPVAGWDFGSGQDGFFDAERNVTKIFGYSRNEHDVTSHEIYQGRALTMWEVPGTC